MHRPVHSMPHPYLPKTDLSKSRQKSPHQKLGDEKVNPHEQTEWNVAAQIHVGSENGGSTLKTIDNQQV